MKYIHCRPVRNSWLKALYQHGLIEASEKTRLLADKLYLYKVLSESMGTDLQKYHPKTLGLQEFIQKHQLWTPQQGFAPGEKIKTALQIEFATDVILKPAAVINTGGEEGLYLFSTQALLRAFTDQHPDLTKACARTSPYAPPLLGIAASGEEFILQEHIAGIAGMALVDKTKHYEEIRIHTYEDQVLRGASFSRWAENEIKHSKKFYWAQDFVQDFLNHLPKEFLQGQVWGLDLLAFDNGTLRILEINTNRGEKGQWTGFLSRPHLMGAYTRMIESKKNVRFAGLSGVLLRNNYGNITKHLKKKYIEGIR